jgi:3-phytase
LYELKVPDKFAPDVLGEQKKGIQNNLGFEGLTSSLDGTRLYAMTEAPLFQDEGMPDGSVTRLLFWKPVENINSLKEYFYKLDPLSQTDQGVEIFRGPSEILEVAENKILVLERGVRLSKSLKRSYTGSLYLVDFSKATEISSLKNLKMPDVVYPEKKKLIDFESDYSGAKGKVVENFEAMSWGPVLKDGKKTLIIASDNNFSKNEKTEFLLFSVQE